MPCEHSASMQDHRASTTAGQGTPLHESLQSLDSVVGMARLLAASLAEFHFPIQNKFSVIMLSYKRPQHLLWQVHRLMSLPQVHRLYVRVNSGEGSIPKDIEAKVIRHPRVQLEYCERNSMNNRFVMPPDIETEWVFNIDDDIEFQNREIEWAFNVARQRPAQVRFIANALPTLPEWFRATVASPYHHHHRRRRRHCFDGNTCVQTTDNGLLPSLHGAGERVRRSGC